MKNFNYLLTIAAASFALMSAHTSVNAQMDHSKMDHSKMGSGSMAAMTDGEIRKVDKDVGKVTIKHGEIKNLDMPGMTMIFTAKDKAMLDQIQVGDKVKFAVINEGGKMVVTDIQPVK